MKKKIYLYPQFNEKIGYGHLKREINFYNVLKNKFDVIFILDTKILNFNFPYIINKNNLKDIINNAEYLVIDFRYYNKKFIRSINEKTNLIIIDSPTLFPSAFYETIYINITTPIKYKKLSRKQFVYQDISLYPLPVELNKKIKKNSKKIFIIFGNSDPNKLTKKILLTIENSKNKFFVNIGQFFNKKYSAEIKNIIRNNKNFVEVKNYYNDFLNSEKIITSYGLTFIEAVILKKDIALLNNSKYHTKLSRYFSDAFYYLGTNKFTPKTLLKSRINFFINTYKKSNLNFDYRFDKNKLLDILKKNKFFIIKNCPICNSNNIDLIFNNKDKQIYSCRNCGTKVQYINTNHKNIYNEKYFTDKYKNQYGNTYIKDKENIIKFAKERLNIIKKINKNFNSILDIGCAYGFFMLEALKYFKIVKGIEINKTAASYGINELSLDISVIDLVKYRTKNKYDVITMWYVLEHFKNPEKIIEKIKKLLKPGGILCLSIPNGAGSLYKFNRKLWFKLHPDDHYFDYTIKSLNIFLKKYGFKLIKYRITGIHPDRIGIKYRGKIINFIFRLLKIGDTMELYFKYTGKD